MPAAGLASDFVHRADLKKMNLESQTYDGIERVDEDARVHFMPYAIEIMRDILGFDCVSFQPEECEQLAREQMRRFQDLERRSKA